MLRISEQYASSMVSCAVGSAVRRMAREPLPLAWALWLSALELSRWQGDFEAEKSRALRCAGHRGGPQGGP